MTTPDGGWPTADLGGGLLSVGGAGGTLGTNMLQSGLDVLNRSVNALTTAIRGLGNLGGNNYRMPTQQQQSPANYGFSPVINPFSRPQQAGIGGGGPGGAGNVAPPNTFSGIGRGIAYGAAGAAVGSMLGSVASFGTNMMQNQLAMNAYAFNSQLGMPIGSKFTGTTTFGQAYGVNNNSLTALSTGALDSTAGAQLMQYLAGSPVINSTSLGRAGYGATASFGFSNPTLSLSQSAQLAQNLYSPQTAQALFMSGMASSRQMGSGKPYTSASIARQLIQNNFINGGRGFINPGELRKGLGMGGRFNASLQFAGINPTAAQPYIELYNQLFSRGYTTSAAQGLVTAASQAGSGQKAALQQLANAGVPTSDIQRIKDANAQQTGRQAILAPGFNEGLSTATSLLGRFNQMLNTILGGTGLGNVLGAGGGLAGAFGGGRGIIGGAMTGGIEGLIIKKMLGGRGAAGVSGWATRGVTGAGDMPLAVSGAGGGASLLEILGPAAAGVVAGIGLKWLSDKAGAKSPMVKAMGNSSPLANNPLGGPLTGGIAAWLSLHLADLWGGGSGKPTNGGGVGSRYGMPNVGGGVLPSPGGQQGSPKGGKQQGSGGGISRKAMSAVRAAESQIGIPYGWGMEAPGVGFDCSGLIQWAYAQAGVNLPRTSGQQWDFLRKRAIGMNHVQEGDLVFMAGSDGTNSAPGHVGMMISKDHLIQAPYTGKDVGVIPYNPGDWSHAARPSGSLIGAAGPSGGYVGSGGAGAGIAGLAGNAGMGGTSGINYSEAAVASNMGELASIGGAGGAMGAAIGGLMHSRNGSGGRRAVTSIGGSVQGSFAANQRMMKRLAAAYGWSSGSMWTSLNNVVMAESGYNNLAQNPGSTAFGIGQFLDSTWAPYGPKTSNARLQEKYMLEYIKGRYGNPGNAWNHEKNIGWYGGGGPAAGGSWGIVGDRGPELVHFGADSHVFSNKQTMDMLKGISAQVTQSPWSTMSERMGSSGACVNVNFTVQRGAIMIQAAAGSDASQAATQVAQKIVDHLTSEQVHDAIRRGLKL